MATRPARSSASPWRTAVCVLFLGLAAGCTPDLPQMDAAVHRDQVEEWHRNRIARLLEPEGWLSVIGLDWLEPGENSFGADSSNAVVFPSLEGVPALAGTFVLDGETVRMDVAPGVEITWNGQPVETLTLLGPELEEAVTPRLGSLRWRALRRQNLTGIRLRDTAAAALAEFEGIQRFPVSLDWRIPARFEPHDPPKILEVPNVLGQISEQPSPGAVVFRAGGRRLSLDVTGDPRGGTLSIVFGDETNGLETYGGGRFLTVEAPDQEGRLFIDFNLAYNPPCVFTDYATCPLPTRDNRLPVAVEAGEKGKH